MAPRPPYDIPFPLSTFPGSTPQESAGRLINCHAEPLGENGPSRAAYHRAPGLTQFAATAQAGYRGGLIVNNLSYETWSGQAATVTSAGVVTLLGALPGTKKVSIARDLAAVPDVVAVDIDNGAFVLSGGGAPVAYNGGGNLPQPNSVNSMDGFFNFTIADGRVFASGINALTQNSLTFVKLQSKSDVTLLRGLNYSGLQFYFTTGGCEVWQNTGTIPSPAFPYSRLVTLPYGLIQANAIAGWETGFDDLLWVAQDFGVYRLPWGALQPTKVSPPDLDRLIKTQAGLGNVLEASAYEFAGKKFWALSSPAWTWECNLGALGPKSGWNERFSLNAGNQGRWRATGGHPAFGKWLCGDTQGGTLAFIDDTVLTELGAPQLRRIESGPVADFPNRLRVARADFNYSTGAGIATGAAPNIINPSVAISWSDDDGVNWKNPIVRSLGLQGKSLRTRISVKNTGLSGPQARRWRLDDTDCAAPFMSAKQSDDPREY
jgi:hypothetical protein